MFPVSTTLRCRTLVGTGQTHVRPYPTQGRKIQIFSQGLSSFGRTYLPVSPYGLGAGGTFVTHTAAAGPYGLGGGSGARLVGGGPLGGLGV